MPGLFMDIEKYKLNMSYALLYLTKFLECIYLYGNTY